MKRLMYIVSKMYKLTYRIVQRIKSVMYKNV